MKTREPRSRGISRKLGKRAFPRVGFTLVITVLVLVLLAVVAVGLLTLSSVTVRTEGRSAYQQQARANARLAMMLALGELQKQLGPDQRVTAAGDLANNPAPERSHWVGVWSSEDKDEDGIPDGTFLGWLSSDPKASEFGSIRDRSTEEQVRLVGNGTVNLNANSSAGVQATRLRTPGGGLAWWVGDEGLKGRVNLSDLSEEIRYSSQGTPRASLEVMEGFGAFDPAAAEWPKVISNGSLELLEGSTKQAVRSHFHDLTVHSLGLQTDTRGGGLKTDLSLLFELNDREFEDEEPAEYAAYVNADTPIGADQTADKGLLFLEHSEAAEGEGIYGPTIDLLRSHYRRYKSNKGTLQDPLIPAMTSHPNKGDFGSDQWRRTACIHGWCWGLLNDPASNKELAVMWWGGNSEPKPTTRILSGNMTPYLNRAIVYFSAKAEPVDEDRYKLVLKIQPILYVHNPYNVRMEVASMRYLKNISEAQLFVSLDGTILYDDPRHPERGIDFTRLLDKNDNAKPLTSGDRRGEAQFVVKQPTTFEPGEVKIFVPAESQNWGSEMKMVELGDEFQPDLMALTLDVNFELEGGTNSTTGSRRLAKIPYGTQVQMTLRWGNFAKQDFEISETGSHEFNTVWSALSQWLPDYSTGKLTRNGYQDVRKAPSHRIEDLQTITPVVVKDIFIKPAMYDRREPSGGVTTIPGFPSFVLGNPLCSSDSNVFGITGSTVRYPGSGSYSTMWNSHMDFGKVGYPYLQDAFIDTWGTWGSNNGSAGERYTSVLEVPIAPLQSLGSLQHANISTVGRLPGLAIGNSFPVLMMSNHRQDSESLGNAANYDLPYLANEALWDRYFFSSISPRPGDSSYLSPTASASSDLQRVIEDFLDGRDTLSNPRMQFLGNGLVARDSAVEVLSHYRTSAAVLGVQGAFNINSTSKEAWKAVLAGYRSSNLRLRKGTEKLDDASALPRLSQSLVPGQGDPMARDEESWQTYALFDDDQIDKLAEAIVKEIKERATERHGNAAITPALTLGQFVNRTLEGNDAMQLRGIIQAAIENSGINDKLDSYATFYAANYGTYPEQTAFAGDARNLETSVTLSATASLLQSDVLQAIGASITPRSDTFRIRAYGDATDRNGKVLARAWCEAIVQRTPRPIASAPSNEWEVDSDSPLANFGRRFTIVSFRWLSPKEV